MSNKTSLLLREYDSLSNLYSVMPKTIGSSMFSPGQAFLWTCIDVSEKYIAIGTDVGLLFLYDRSKGVICHQLSSKVYTVLLCLSLLVLLYVWGWVSCQNLWFTLDVQMLLLTPSLLTVFLFLEFVQIRYFILHILSSYFFISVAINGLLLSHSGLERLVAWQLFNHMHVHRLLPSLQSAYQAQHSTETLVLKVLSDILTAADRSELLMLTLLDLSAALDTVDHLILLHRLMTSYEVNGVVHSWISFCLTNHTQYVCCPGSRSTLLPVFCGVPQGSVVGPILFLLYTADLVQLVESFELYPHLYADDTQIYGLCWPRDTDSLRKRVADCVAAVVDWMCSNRLQLNASKTEVLWSPSTKSATFWFVGCWLWSCVAYQMRVRSWYFHWR